jgi:hypothetical protein
MVKPNIPEKLEIGNSEHISIRRDMENFLLYEAIAKEIEVLCPICDSNMRLYRVIQDKFIEFMCEKVCDCCGHECEEYETMSWEELKELHQKEGYASLDFLFDDSTVKDTETLYMFDK